ncbi:17-beta-hydroxysteroid dehydrogenase 13-like [Mya arenaria]|uniref:17-beta-hydroxysteroid dehydrogenase 13-like n=1 Tax=Mya arenaria TaxID=6604 RepID=UPI0022E370F0|nr:17-beta-hydroxysteroid dehydrogenase 13-like [Mya arenaria]XP_052762549.1 17-beta-hydroxysteroid dehydrogenase 13-like [Mya arenaria]
MYIVIQIFQTLFYLIYCYLEAVIRFFVPVKKKSFAGTIVLVTGAGHGIGKELAMKFSEVGARLILWDINKRQVEEVEQTIRKSRHKDDAAKSYVCDVSKVENIKATAAKMRREVGEVEVLVNNAGILHGGSLLEMSEEDIKRTFDVNILAYIWTCREFLPYMVRRNEGHIVNMASMSAQTGVAYLTEYSASKYAVRGFTEALKDEMRREGHTGINFTTVYPMFVATGMTKYTVGIGVEWLTPAQVAIAVVEGAQMNETSVFIPSWYRGLLKISSLWPSKFKENPNELMYKGINPQYKERND